MSVLASRLQECYANPEVIDSTLFKQLDSFPHFSLKENIKVRKCSDLLVELVAAKTDKYLPASRHH